MRGSEEQFLKIIDELAKNTRGYESGEVKHYSWVDRADNIFKSYGWSKIEFYKEINARLNIRTQEEKAVPKPKKKPIKKI